MKEDLRITKSKRDLRNAMMSLLKTHTFDSITVKEICDVALINRMTFYKHYEDKYDLFNDTVRFTINTIKQSVMDEIKPQDMFSQPAKFCTTIVSLCLDECVTRKELLQRLVQQDNPLVSQIIFESVQESVMEFLKMLDALLESKYPLELVSNFITGGASHAIYYWLCHPNSYSREKFISACEDCFTQIMESRFFFRRTLPPENH